VCTKVNIKSTFGVWFLDIYIATYNHSFTSYSVKHNKYILIIYTRIRIYITNNTSRFCRTAFVGPQQADSTFSREKQNFVCIKIHNRPQFQFTLDFISVEYE